MKTGMLLCALFAFPAAAEVSAATPSMMQIQETVRIAASPQAVFKDLGRIDRWWSSAHTFSGDARHLHLAMRADGLFSEEWKDGGVVHGRVLRWERNKLLRLEAALGPLQELGVRAVLTFALAPAGKGTEVTLSYRVSGDPSQKLDTLAPVVDEVLKEQLERFEQFARTGKTPPAAPAQKPAGHP